MSKLEADKQKDSGYYLHIEPSAAIPTPPPPLLGTEVAATGEVKQVSIEKYALLDEGDPTLRVFIALEGELAGVRQEDVESVFKSWELKVTVTTAHAVHRLNVRELGKEVPSIGRVK